MSDAAGEGGLHRFELQACLRPRAASEVPQQLGQSGGEWCRRPENMGLNLGPLAQQTWACQQRRAYDATRGGWVGCL